jgi:hypothetical protein
MGPEQLPQQCAWGIATPLPLQHQGGSGFIMGEIARNVSDATPQQGVHA